MRRPAQHVDAVPMVQSFDAFYRREWRPVVALAAVLSGSRWAAQDLAQEAFSAAYEQWGRVGGYEHPEMWVRRVVANKSVSLIRRRVAEARARVRLGRVAPLEVLPDESEEVWEAVRRLPRRQGQAIALTYLDGLTVDEVAAVLECEPVTVKTHLQRGRATLAKQFASPVREMS